MHSPKDKLFPQPVEHLTKIELSCFHIFLLRSHRFSLIENVEHYAQGPHFIIFFKLTPNSKEPGMMTVASSYSLGSALWPWGSGWRRADPVAVSPALFPAGFVVAAAAPNGAPSLQVPAAASWPAALAEAGKQKRLTSARKTCAEF